MLNESNQLQQLDAYRINDRYFAIHPMDIADDETTRILQCLPYLPEEYRGLVANAIRSIVPDFDLTFAKFNQLCDKELNRYLEYANESYHTMDDSHADSMADLPF